MASERLPKLGKKLRYLYAYTGMNAKSLAGRLDRSESTLTGWVKGTKTSRPEFVPEYGRARLAAILAEALGGAIDEDAARILWLGPEEQFARVFLAPPALRFLDVLATAERTDMLTYLRAAGETRLVDYSGGEAARGAIRANVGERFAFEVTGVAGAQIVLVSETAVGTHLGVPGPGSPARLDSAGRARLPAAPGAYQFEEPKGLHRFLAFAVDAPEPLSIAACAGRRTPLDESELNAFAAELCDRKRVRSWVLDTLLVDVR